MQKLCVLMTILLLTCGLSFAQDAEKFGYEIALERIEKAHRTGATELNLSNLGLENLPQQIGNLTNLERLELGFNKLSTLPPEIGNLSNLKYLSVHNNQINHLPSEIGNLVNLLDLIVYSNQLEQLPIELTQLTNLKILRADFNQLTEIPVGISNLIKLRKLEISHNWLDELTPEIEMLKNLCVLNIGNNNITHLPTGISQINTFELAGCYISTKGNPLIFPPSEIADKGTEYILNFLYESQRQQRERHLTVVVSTIGFCLLIMLVLGLRWRGRRMGRKSKRKNDTI